MIKKYEIMYIIDKDVENLKSVQDKMTAILKESGGKIVASEDWGLIKFAYKINHKEAGYYSVIITETETTNVDEFQRIAKIDKNIVRTLVINTESERKYIQSTKYSPTDISQFKEEPFRKSGGRFERKFRTNRDDNQSSGHSSSERPESNYRRPSNYNNRQFGDNTSQSTNPKPSPDQKPSDQKPSGDVRPKVVTTRIRKDSEPKSE